MIGRVRVPRASKQESASPLPPEVTDRTDRLVEIFGQCKSAKDTAEAAGENFLVFLLSMAAEECQTAMRRATVGEPPPEKRGARKAPQPRLASRGSSAN